MGIFHLDKSVDNISRVDGQICTKYSIQVHPWLVLLWKQHMSPLITKLFSEIYQKRPNGNGYRLRLGPISYGKDGDPMNTSTVSGNRSASTLRFYKVFLHLVTTKYYMISRILLPSYSDLVYSYYPAFSNQCINTKLFSASSHLSLHPTQPKNTSWISA